MTQWVLMKNGQVVPWRTLRKLTAEQLKPSNEIEQQKHAVFDADIRRILGDQFSLPVDGIHVETIDINQEESDEFYGPMPFLDNADKVPRSVPVSNCVDANGQPILAGCLTDVMISD